MYGIYTYIWLISMVNVGKHTIHGSYGIWIRHVLYFFRHQVAHHRAISFHQGEGIGLSCWCQLGLSHRCLDKQKKRHPNKKRIGVVIYIYIYIFANPHITYTYTYNILYTCYMLISVYMQIYRYTYYVCTWAFGSWSSNKNKVLWNPYFQAKKMRCWVRINSHDDMQ